MFGSFIIFCSGENLCKFMQTIVFYSLSLYREPDKEASIAQQMFWDLVSCGSIKGGVFKSPVSSQKDL